VNLFNDTNESAPINNELITESGMSILLKREATINVEAEDMNTNFTLNGDVFVRDEEDTNTTETAGLLKDDLVAAGYDAANSSWSVTISGFEVDTLVNGNNMNSSIATEIYLDEDADGAFSLDSGVTLTNLTVTVQVDTPDDELKLSVAEGADFTEVRNADTDISYGVSELGTYYEADVDEYTSILCRIRCCSY